MQNSSVQARCTIMSTSGITSTVLGMPEYIQIGVLIALPGFRGCRPQYLLSIWHLWRHLESTHSDLPPLKPASAVNSSHPDCKQWLHCCRPTLLHDHPTKPPFSRRSQSSAVRTYTVMHDCTINICSTHSGRPACLGEMSNCTVCTDRWVS